MRRALLTLCLAACCLVPLYADEPTDPVVDPAIDFPAQPDFASAVYHDIGHGISKVCSVSVSCGGGVTLSCSGSSCTSESGRCVSCTTNGTTRKQFCQGSTGNTCNGTAVVNFEEAGQNE
ncbi:MAG: hypothetical protein AAGE94_00550 [Acidobacteriota bacterium]